MKLFAMLFVSFAAASAMACPNLDGVYQCQKDANDPADSGVISLETLNHNGATYYQLTDKEDASNPSVLPADGVAYNQQDGSVYTGTCAGEVFNANVVGKDEAGTPVEINISLSLDAAKNLNQSVVYKSGDQVYNGGEICTKL